MKERPIQFNEDEISAALTDGKVFMHIPLEPQPPEEINEICHAYKSMFMTYIKQKYGQEDEILSPYEAGERVWIQETWGVGTRPCPINGWDDGLEYRSDEAYLEDGDDLPLHQVNPPNGVDLDEFRGGWQPATRMPRWASRLVMEVADVQAKRIKGVWVWVIEFKKLERRTL